jgi:hypothetical protein
MSLIRGVLLHKGQDAEAFCKRFGKDRLAGPKSVVGAPGKRLTAEFCKEIK